MRVAFLGAVPFSLIFGGGETQLLNTMNMLKKQGVNATLYDHWDRYVKYEILHIFGCHHWLYQTAMLAKARGIRIALSTISYNPSPGFLYNTWSFFDPLIPVETTYRLNRKLIKIADVLLPNSHAEAEYLERYFDADAQRIIVVPNAADLRYADASADLFIQEYGLLDFVLCVGKIEPRKNQLNLVKALSGTGIMLVLIGSPIPQQKAYYDQVKREAQKNGKVLFIESLPHDSELLSSAYAASNVHVLLGKNETPGIVNLEAALAGAKLVAAECKPVREYLGNFADYCNPESVEDIKNTVLIAMQKPKLDQLRKIVSEKYTWDVAAQKTLEAYSRVLSQSFERSTL